MYVKPEITDFNVFNTTNKSTLQGIVLKNVGLKYIVFLTQLSLPKNSTARVCRDFKFLYYFSILNIVLNITC
jgi:hypothetical protein